MALIRADDVNQNITQIDRRIEELNTEIANIEKGDRVISTVTDAIDASISERKNELRIVQQSISDLDARVQSNFGIKNEIESEVDTLSLNEEARRVFMSFSEICQAEGCGMFLKSSEAYAKNLLYLKDQIKDLDSVTLSIQESIKKKKGTETNLISIIDLLLAERASLIEESPVRSAVKAVSRATKELIKLELEKLVLTEIEQLESQLLEFQYQRDKAQERLDSISNSGESSTVGVIKFKNRLQKLLTEWIGKLNTKNVPNEIEILNDFKAKFGGEVLTKFDGSTRLRIVLAYHAAIVKTISEFNPFGLRILILDTPAQHNISFSDLDVYLKALYMLAKNNGVQIVFSTTEYQYPIQDGDVTVTPEFEGFEQLMYLGDVSEK
jgi:hypothetical protein